MVTREARALSRDVEVAAIPYGDRLTLTMGTTVFITQALGGSFTAMTDHGYLVRIEGKDADTIGEKPVLPMTAEDTKGRSTQDLAWDRLKTCFDPEIPVNIVDLGLVYDVEVTDDKVAVKMTLTAPGCPIHDVMPEWVRTAVMRVPGVERVDVTLTFEPAWTPERIQQ